MPPADFPFPYTDESDLFKFEDESEVTDQGPSGRHLTSEHGDEHGESDTEAAQEQNKEDVRPQPKKSSRTNNGDADADGDFQIELEEDSEASIQPAKAAPKKDEVEETDVAQTEGNKKKRARNIQSDTIEGDSTLDNRPTKRNKSSGQDEEDATPAVSRPDRQTEGLKTITRKFLSCKRCCKPEQDRYVLGTVQCANGHVYCESCIEDTPAGQMCKVRVNSQECGAPLGCSDDRRIKNIGFELAQELDLEVSCKFFGCAAKFSTKKIGDHEKKCAYRPCNGHACLSSTNLPALRSHLRDKHGPQQDLGQTVKDKIDSNSKMILFGDNLLLLLRRIDGNTFGGLLVALDGSSGVEYSIKLTKPPKEVHTFTKSTVKLADMKADKILELCEDEDFGFEWIERRKKFTLRLKISKVN